MTLETFIECFEHQCKISLGIRRRVALLGGEPTVAKSFKDIVGFITNNLFRVNNFLIFSNLSGVENVKWLAQQCFEDIEFVMIWNSTGLSSYAHTLRKKVYDSLEILKKAKIKITASITMEYHQEVKDFEYLIDAKRNYNISNIRFALDTGSLPEFRTKSNTVFQVLRFLQDNEFSIGIDGCGSPALNIFNQAQIKDMLKINGIDIHCGGSAGIDILPDGTCIPCMPYLSYTGQRPKLTDLKSLDDLKEFYGFTPRTKMLCPAHENIARLNMLSLKKD